MFLQIKGSILEVINLDRVQFIDVSDGLFSSGYSVVFCFGSGWSRSIEFDNKRSAKLALEYILHKISASGDQKVLELEYDNILRYIDDNY